MDIETSRQIKSVFRSKTIWINIIALIALIIEKQYGFGMSADLQMELLTIVNIILRLITHEKISWK